MTGFNAGAGYDLVTNEAAPHDLVARLAVSATQEQSFFHVTVNGRQQVTLKVHVALTVVGGAGVVDEVAHDFESSNGEVRDENVSPLVTGLNSSSRLAHYASDQANARRAKAETEQAAARQAQKQAADAMVNQVREEEESTWVRARPLGCRLPATLDACDSVRMYLVKYPSGAHTDEAKTALAEAAPKLEGLQKDDNAWHTAGPDGCRAHADPHACDGVDLYLVKFPTGLHANEARALTAKPSP